MLNDMSHRLRKVMNTAFPHSQIPENLEELQYGAFDEWDSLGNYALLMLVEQEFQVEFTMRELSEIKSVREIFVKLQQH